jgi:hypothetical protein
MSSRIRPSALFFLLSSVSIAFAASPSGTVVDVNQNAKASGSEGARLLLSQGAVFSGDEITTDYKGIAQIIFVDNTRFVIGPNSRTTIDRFIFNPDNTARAVTISATKGAFRFITGVSPHQAYSIRTPAMTIGVRGTKLDFTVEVGTGRVTEALYSGGTTNCDSSGACINVDDVCAVVIALPGGPVSNATPEERSTALAISLPFAQSQRALDDAFKVDTSSCDNSSSLKTKGPTGDNKGRDGPPPPKVEPTSSSPSF